MNHEPEIYNAADPKKVRAAHKKEIRGREREIEDLRYVLRSSQGRRVIWGLLCKCHAFASVFDPSGSKVYYNAGKQDIGHWMLSEIQEVDPNKLIEMMIEEKDEKNV